MELRGVLCTSCNMRLSNRHTVEWLEKALEYLSHPPANEYFLALAMKDLKEIIDER